MSVCRGHGGVYGQSTMQIQSITLCSLKLSVRLHSRGLISHVALVSTRLCSVSQFSLFSKPHRNERVYEHTHAQTHNWQCFIHFQCWLSSQFTFTAFANSNLCNTHCWAAKHRERRWQNVFPVWLHMKTLCQLCAGWSEQVMTARLHVFDESFYTNNDNIRLYLG